MLLRDREDAAHRLAWELRAYQGQDPLILAIPRGAVPMGRILAESLDGELDVVLVHKLGAPGNPEYAIGAVSETGEVILRGALAGERLPAGYVENEAARQLAVLRQRRARYTPERLPADPRDRVVIVVDDGIATGATFKAALSLVRTRGPTKLIAAVGVAPEESLAEVRALADEVVCLETPPLFFAVGEFYDDFRQVGDDEVVAMLQAAGTRRASVERPPAAAQPAARPPVDEAAGR
jgi:predicted phosphoribosyltransferase